MVGSIPTWRTIIGFCSVQTAQLYHAISFRTVSAFDALAEAKMRMNAKIQKNQGARSSCFRSRGKAIRPQIDWTPAERTASQILQTAPPDHIVVGMQLAFQDSMKDSQRISILACALGFAGMCILIWRRHWKAELVLSADRINHPGKKLPMAETIFRYFTRQKPGKPSSAEARR